VSAVARGIAEAEIAGKAANAQAATPISSRRFMWEFSLEDRLVRHEENALTAPGFRAGVVMLQRRFPTEGGLAAMA
jgi:hypothetical protein